MIRWNLFPIWNNKSPFRYDSKGIRIIQFSFFSMIVMSNNPPFNKKIRSHKHNNQWVIAISKSLWVMIWTFWYSSLINKALFSLEMSDDKTSKVLSIPTNWKDGSIISETCLFLSAGFSISFLKPNVGHNLSC